MSQWITTHLGRDHFLSGPEVMSNQIDIGDVAWSLAQINRYTGHANRPYSVAEHSLLVADLAKDAGCSQLVQLLCLMHDGHESTTGDVSGPAKVAVGLSWSKFEALQADRFRRALHLVTGYAAYRDQVHYFDLVALATERRDLSSWRRGQNLPWPVIDAEGAEIKPADVNLNSIDRLNRSWTQWRDAFLARWIELLPVVYPHFAEIATPADPVVTHHPV